MNILKIDFLVYINYILDLSDMNQEGILLVNFGHLNYQNINLKRQETYLSIYLE